jgi:aerobic-type carbon monoxide dehydrogenase small subunit (CoxS/CutS family)
LSLGDKPALSPDQIIGKMDDVICRCGTHLRIKKGIRKAAQLMTRREVTK